MFFLPDRDFHLQPLDSFSHDWKELVPVSCCNSDINNVLTRCTASCSVMHDCVYDPFSFPEFTADPVHFLQSYFSVFLEFKELGTHAPGFCSDNTCERTDCSCLFKVFRAFQLMDQRFKRVVFWLVENDLDELFQIRTLYVIYSSDNV